MSVSYQIIQLITWSSPVFYEMIHNCTACLFLGYLKTFSLLRLYSIGCRVYSVRIPNVYGLIFEVPLANIWAQEGFAIFFPYQNIYVGYDYVTFSVKIVFIFRI
jgi:hypothetical protein